MSAVKLSVRALGLIMRPYISSTCSGSCFARPYNLIAVLSYGSAMLGEFEAVRERNRQVSGASNYKRAVSRL